mmetsp:Transcript_28419/g.78313  ORF Transcript_28419/g.78313 Transcript_28419/m.78313 type:complete len:298 (+) Transcript_28419:76-969(+)
MDEWHAVCSAVELAGVAVLFGYQGILQTKWPFVKLRPLLCARLKKRFVCPRRGSAGAIAIIAVLGSASLGAVGLFTGFVVFGLPKDWAVAVPRLGILLVMPGFLEEVVFRGLLLRSAAELARRAPGAAAATPRVELERGGLPKESPCASPLEETKTPGSVELHFQDDVTVVGMKESRTKDDEEETKSVARSTVPFVTHNGVSWSTGDKTPESHVDARGKVAGEPRPPILEQAGAMVIFVVYHLDAMHSLQFFRDPRFLALAAILGVCCQEALLRSSSLWPGIALHGIWVWAWLSFGH